MNDRFDLRIITQPHSQVYWGYFRRLVFGNSSTKHNKLTYFSNSMLFCSDVLLPFSHIPRCIHAKTPDFPRLFEPRVNGVKIGYTGERKYSEYPNWPSVDMFYEHVLASIHRDISLGRKLGPWDSPHYQTLLGRQWARFQKSALLTNIE